MNFDTFFSDFTSALLTGIAVGLALIGAETFMGWRRRRRATTVAQEAAVEALIMPLRVPFDYVGLDLKPIDSGIRLAADIVVAVPPGQSWRRAPGYEFLPPMIKEWKQLDATADLLVSAINAAARRISDQQIAAALLRGITNGSVIDLVHGGIEWDLDPWVHDLEPAKRLSIANDRHLNDLATSYVYSKRMLDAYRQAYSFSVDRARESIWTLWVHRAFQEWTRDQILDMEKKIVLSSDVKARQIVYAMAGRQSVGWEPDFYDYMPFMLSRESDLMFWWTKKRVEDRERREWEIANRS